MYDSICKRCRYAAFRFNSRIGQVKAEGKLWINVPFRCDGVGLVSLGRGVSIGFLAAPIAGDGMVRLQARAKGAVIEVGAGTFFSNNVQVIAESRVTIGERCLISDGVLIMDSDAHALSAAGRHHQAPLISPVHIEDNVFIGSRSIILKGVTIGKDSVIGAGSVVVRSIPPGVIAAGNPAKVIRPL
jgi:acetyltransferase-like isoleucine patch superfamily enzyme